MAFNQLEDFNSRKFQLFTAQTQQHCPQRIIKKILDKPEHLIDRGEQDQHFSALQPSPASLYFN